MKIMTMSLKNIRVLAVAALVSCSALSVQAETCTISRNAAGDPPMSWDNGDYVTSPRYTSESLEHCNIPTNATITQLRVAFNAAANRSILTEGLLLGDYAFSVSGGGASGEVVAGVQAQGFVGIGSSGILTSFNGLSLYGLNLSLVGRLRDAVSIRCRDGNPSVCEDYMYFNYTIQVDYEGEDNVPDFTASYSDPMMYMSWSAVPGATAYQVRRVDGSGNVFHWNFSAATTEYNLINMWEDTFTLSARAKVGGVFYDFSTETTVVVGP